MTKTNTRHLAPQGLLVYPDQGPMRELTFTPDAHGASISDTASGLTVTLDWSGEELRAIITAEGQDDPTYIHVLKTKGTN